MRRTLGSFGLIAGGGELPLAVARSVREKGRRLILVSLSDDIPPQTYELAGKTYRATPHNPREIISILAGEGVCDAVMIGKLWKHTMFTQDDTIRALDDFLGAGSPRNDDAILLAFASALAKAGITLHSQLDYLGELVAERGVLTRCAPEARDWDDLALGYRVAKHVTLMDIGQSVVVKAGVVLAVEAVEGTDAAIRRGGALGRGGVVVKVSKVSQDVRFDVPAIGPDTLGVMNEVSIRVLGVEAGKTIIVRKEDTLREADRLGISIVGLDERDLAGRGNPL